MRVHHQPAYVLLNRPYSETSWIVEVFSRDFGRLALIAKGARRIKSQLKGVLLPFQPLLLSWTGKGEVPTLTSAEIRSGQINFFEQELRGDHLVCGFYCNELLVYLLHRHDPHAALFERYNETILGLYKSTPSSLDVSLSRSIRRFEQMMIKEAGYAVSFELEADGKTEIEADGYYQFQANQGFVPAPASYFKAVSGEIIIALAGSTNGLANEQDESVGKHLMRDILTQTVGYKRIHSRELFFPRPTNADKTQAREPD